MVSPADQEHQLELCHDRARHAAHDVVEALVGEVVLDAAATHPRDPAVDDRHLAVIEMEQVGAAGASPADRVAREAAERQRVVRDDGDPRGMQVGEQRLAAERDLAADGVHLEPHIHSLARLAHQRVAEARADGAWLVAIDEDVDLVLRGLDVLEHAREVPATVQVRCHARGHARRGAQDPVVPTIRASAASSTATPSAMSSVMAFWPPEGQHAWLAQPRRAIVVVVVASAGAGQGAPSSDASLRCRRVPEPSMRAAIVAQRAPSPNASQEPPRGILGFRSRALHGGCQMPELPTIEGENPELRLPEISRDEIVRSSRRIVVRTSI